MGRPRESKLLEATAQRIRMESQDRCRALRAFDDPPSLPQNMEDQDRRIGGGDTTNLVQHRDQSQTPTNDLLEVVDGLELLLEVAVLLCQPGGLGLSKMEEREFFTDGETRVGDSASPCWTRAVWTDEITPSTLIARRFP